MENNLLDDLSYLDIEKPKFVYAGLGKRFVALVIDWFCFMLVLVPIFVILALVDVLLSYEASAGIRDFLAGLVALLYYPVLESSRLQGSLGKHFLNIKVVDKEGNRLSFGLASARFALKIFSYVIAFIGFIMIAFTKKKQGLHDIILNTYVVEK